MLILLLIIACVGPIEMTTLQTAVHVHEYDHDHVGIFKKLLCETKPIWRKMFDSI